MSGPTIRATALVPMSMAKARPTSSRGTTSPIITFTMADGTGVQDRLVRAGVDVRVASNYVRFSPSVYNDLADVDTALAALS